MNATRVFHRFLHSIDAEIIHLLACDDGDGLRSFAQGERKLGDKRSRLRRVAADVFSAGFALGLAGNGDGGEGGFFLCGRRGGSLCFGLGLDGGSAILLGEQ
jgi:hypothetical protein